MGCYPVVNKVVTADQKLILQHNYMAIMAEGNAEIDIEVSYAILDNNNNKTIVQKLKTPCLIGGEDVMVYYDLMEATKNNQHLFYFCKVKEDSVYKQAGDIKIKNLSDKTLEYAIMNNIPIKFLTKEQLFYHKFANVEIIKDDTKVFTSFYNIRLGPIYKWTPVLYLIKPDLAPNAICYAGETFIGGSTKKIYVKEVPLKKPYFGDITAHNPYSIEEIIEIYRNKAHMLFENYDYQHLKESINNNRINLYYGKVKGKGSYINTDKNMWINIKLKEPVNGCL